MSILGKKSKTTLYKDDNFQLCPKMSATVNCTQWKQHSNLCTVFKKYKFRTVVCKSEIKFTQVI